MKNKNNPHGLTVGQALYFVPNKYSRGEPREVNVLAVGRKWVSVGRYKQPAYRIDAVSLVADGGGYSSPGKCYLDKSDFEMCERLDAEWFDLVSRLTLSRPKHVSLKDIASARRILLGAE